MQKSILTILAPLGLLCLSLVSCAGSKADAQLREQECDFLFEYQAIENDSIAILVGNTMRLHAGKATPGNFYPLLLSERDPQELDKPIATEVIQNEDELRSLVRKRARMLQYVGIVIGESTRNAKGFQESQAIAPIRSLVTSLPEVQLFVFQEREGEVQSFKPVP